MLAVTTPLFRSVVVGGLMLGLAVLAPSFLSKAKATNVNMTSHRLVLHTVTEPNAIYLSAWRKGDVNVQFENGELRPITFRVRATIPDGCRWEGTETLVPMDDHTFTYSYDDRQLSCPEGVEPMYRPTPRVGLVTVE
jgi:hypothetical protein